MGKREGHFFMQKTCANHIYTSPLQRRNPHLTVIFCVTGSRGSSVNIVTRLWTGQPWFDSRQEKGYFFTASRLAVGPVQPPI